MGQRWNRNCSISFSSPVLERGIISRPSRGQNTVYKHSTLTLLFLASEFFMLSRRIFIFGLFFASTVADARPASWYWWVSKLDGTRVCAQNPQGSGWYRERTAFKDSRCSIRITPF